MIAYLIIPFLILTAQSFYFGCTTSPSCYLSPPIYPSQQLLIQVQTGVLPVNIAIEITTLKDDKEVFRKKVTKMIDGWEIQSNASQVNTTTSQAQFIVCASIIPSSESATLNGKQIQMVSLKLLKNFTHLLTPSPSSYPPQLFKFSDHLLVTTQEQIDLHHSNEKTQEQAQSNLESLQHKIITVTILQIAVMLLCTITGIMILAKHLRK